jgi:hypothetical protein
MIDHGEVEPAMRLAGAAASIWLERGLGSEGRAWLREALALRPSGRTRARAQALIYASVLAAEQGEHAAASPRSNRAQPSRAATDQALPMASFESPKWPGSAGSSPHHASLRTKVSRWQALLVCETSGTQCVAVHPGHGRPRSTGAEALAEQALAVLSDPMLAFAPAVARSCTDQALEGLRRVGGWAEVQCALDD